MAVCCLSRPAESDPLRPFTADRHLPRSMSDWPRCANYRVVRASTPNTGQIDECNRTDDRVGSITHHVWGESIYDLLAALEPPETDKPGDQSPAFMPFILRFTFKLLSTIKQTDNGWNK